MWRKLNIVFTIKNPLHIGYIPFTKGSVISPTRCYIPGKNFWGAVTRRIAENFFNKPTWKDYQNIGKEIKDSFRFSYFYIYDGNTIYFPEYNEDRGLVFGEKKDSNSIMKRSEFEARFISSRVLTGINHVTGTAKDESLHEIEYIKDKHLDDNGNIKETKLVGCIFVKKNYKLLCANQKKNIEVKDSGIFIDDFNLIKELTLGGEQKYGFGLVKFDSFINENGFYKKYENNSEDIIITIEKENAILSHLKYVKDLSFKGEAEIITGRGYYDIEKINEGSKSTDKVKRNYSESPGKIISEPLYYFSPGTKFVKEIKAILKWNGTIEEIN